MKGHPDLETDTRGRPALPTVPAGLASDTARSTEQRLGLLRLHHADLAPSVVPVEICGFNCGSLSVPFESAFLYILTKHATAQHAPEKPARQSPTFGGHTARPAGPPLSDLSSSESRDVCGVPRDRTEAV